MQNDLGDFLRSRRARIQPGDAGLVEYGRRRVAGLRREEVARLAGVSVDYYVRLEQGRGKHASDAVLEAVARALRLTDSERLHMYALARPGGSVAARAATANSAYSDVVHSGVRVVLDALAAPAFVLGRRMDVLAWNSLGDLVSGFSHVPVAERNQARYLFLDPVAPTFYPEWESVAAETVSFLRRDAGLHPNDPKLAALVVELSARSADFARLWAAHPIKEKTRGTKLIHHPQVGRLELGYETLLLSDPDQLLVVYTAAPGSETAAALARL
ncbi:helix-turn-helix transcriptional regulator, partial [Nocardia tengchongensis]|uniref:helix-turn-helix transcriptional regulator n=1 Tax=Nocardia tengchongensis TaxID=2055889 RepID=UPI00367AFFEE